MMALAAVASGPAARFDCTFDRLGIARSTGGGWDVSALTEFAAKVPFKRLSVTRTEGAAPRLVIQQVGDPFAIAGDHLAIAIRPNHYSWHASGVSYCSVLDAACSPTTDFYEAESGISPLSVSVSSYATGNDGVKRLANLQFLFSCVRSKGEAPRP